VGQESWRPFEFQGGVEQRELSGVGGEQEAARIEVLRLGEHGGAAGLDRGASARMARRL